MENTTQPLDNARKSLNSTQGAKVGIEPYPQNYQTLQNVDLTQNSSFSFSPVVKDKVGNIVKSELLPATLRFQTATNVPVISANTSQVKINSHNALQANIPLHISPANVQLNSNDNSSSILSLDQAVQSCIPISQGTAVPNCASKLTSTSQTLPLFSSSLENCSTGLNQVQPSGQTFILTSNENLISSDTVPQSQLFLQGNELLRVALPSTSASSSYAMSSSEPQYINQIPVVLSSNQAIGTPMSRLLIQTNQGSGTSINNQILSSNNGQYIIQMNPSIPTTSHANKLPLNNKGHIVIKAGSSRVKNLSAVTPVKEGVLRVVIPEGTTKLPKLTHPPQIVNDNENSIKKHVQINLLSTDSIQSNYSHQGAKITKQEPDNIQFMNKKLYECPHCNSKFMKPLYLRLVC